MSVFDIFKQLDACLLYTSDHPDVADDVQKQIMDKVEEERRNEHQMKAAKAATVAAEPAAKPAAPKASAAKAVSIDADDFDDLDDE